MRNKLMKRMNNIYYNIKTLMWVFVLNREHAN